MINNRNHETFTNINSRTKYEFYIFIETLQIALGICSLQMFPYIFASLPIFVLILKQIHQFWHPCIYKVHYDAIYREKQHLVWYEIIIFYIFYIRAMLGLSTLITDAIVFV